MAAILTVNSFLEWTGVCKVQEQYCLNVINFEILTVVNGSLTDAQVGDALDNVMAPLYKDLLATTALYYGSRTQVIAPVRIDPVFITTRQGAGNVAGDQLPTQVAGVINQKTGFASRSKRGRMYLPATSEADSGATGKPSAGYITAAQAFCNGLFTFSNVTIGADQVNLAWAVYSRKLLQHNPVTTYEVRPNWGTIRRRSSIKHADVAPF